MVIRVIIKYPEDFYDRAEIYSDSASNRTVLLPMDGNKLTFYEFLNKIYKKEFYICNECQFIELLFNELSSQLKA